MENVAVPFREKAGTYCAVLLSSPVAKGGGAKGRKECERHVHLSTQTEREVEEIYRRERERGERGPEPGERAEGERVRGRREGKRERVEGKGKRRDWRERRESGERGEREGGREGAIESGWKEGRGKTLLQLSPFVGKLSPEGIGDLLEGGNKPPVLGGSSKCIAL